MRKKLLLFGVLLVTSYTMAQEVPSRHHIELSVGEPFSSLWGFNLQFAQSEDEEHYFHEWANASRPLTEQGYEDEYFVPPIVVGYYYQVLSWLQIGGEIGTMSICTTENTWGDKQLAHYLSTNLYMAAGVRFNYYHKKITDLYSGLTLGANVRFVSTESNPLLCSSGLFCWQITGLGVRFGKSVYGNVELGYGYKGLVSIGVGYRF